MSVLPQVWEQTSCRPRKEVLDGSLVDAELALSLSAVAWGRAKAPYNDPVSFFDSTHFTRNMTSILTELLGRISGERNDVNPIIVLDVGFGGGKTHTLAALYYATKFSTSDKVAKYLAHFPKPKGVRTVVISGDEFGSEGVNRQGTQIRTIWGDLFWQLGKYGQFEVLDKEMKLPSLQDIKTALEGSAVLILLDELPSYLKVVAEDSSLLDKTVQFIQRLVIGVSEKSDAAMIVAIAEDVYKTEAERAKQTLLDAAKEAMEETRAHIKRKETVMVPVEEEDAVHILKRRLFEKINNDTAAQIADAYLKLYKDVNAPENMSKSDYKEEIINCYPFHPALVKVLYERVATIDRFHRTRGALRILARVVRRTWNQHEDDALLIHPFHVDLADGSIVSDLTEGLGEPKKRNAIESDIWKDGGGAVAQELDEQSRAHWGAPLVRRACNVVYLYSLATGKEGDHGIRSDLLCTLCTTPARPDHYLRLRDTVLTMLFENFHFIDRRGERYVFVREPTPIRVVERLARDITDDEALAVLRENLDSFFSGDPEWVHVEPFPKSISQLRDDPYVQVGVLNPLIYSIASDKIPEDIAGFLTHRDDFGKKARQFTNSAFLLVANRDRVDSLILAARKVKAAQLVHENPIKYDISKDRKADVEEYLATQMKNINAYIRAAYSYIVYYDGKVRTQPMTSAGYGDAKSGRAVLAHHLMKTLNRIKDGPLDPAYVMGYCWPRDAKSISVKTLFERFHAVPGLIFPNSKETFQQTILRGIKEDAWVLKDGSKVFYEDNLPSSIPIEDAVELLTHEEAESRGLFAKTPPAVQSRLKPDADTSAEALVDTLRFTDAPIETLAKDLEKKVRREKFTEVNSMNLSMSGNLLHLLGVKNLLTRLFPEKECEARVTANIGRRKSPRYTLTFDLMKDDISSDEGKTLLDLAWRFKGAEECEITLTLDWQNGLSPEDAGKVLTSLTEGSKEPIIARLEAKVSRSA